MSPRTKHRPPSIAPAERGAELLQLAHAAAHDLNAPLRKISAFGDLLKGRMKDKLDSVEADYLERILVAAADAAKIVSDLMTLSRIAHEAYPLETVDLNAVLAGAKADLTSEIAGSGARIEAGRLPALKGNALLLHTLLSNLLSNAVKFRRPGQAPLVRIDSRLEGDSFALAVADEGIGFEPGYAEKIFQPFMRLNAPVLYKGNGLGLAIARAAAERLGGSLAAASEPGRGAVFTLRLPASALAR